MARPPNIQRPVALKLKLPADIRGRLDLHLFSAVEGRVPKGAYQEFFIDRINEYFDKMTQEIKDAQR